VGERLGRAPLTSSFTFASAGRITPTLTSSWWSLSLLVTLVFILVTHYLLRSVRVSVGTSPSVRFPIFVKHICTVQTAQRDQRGFQLPTSWLAEQKKGLYLLLANSGRPLGLWLRP